MSIRNRINRFIKEQKKKARKAFIKRRGFLAQQSLPGEKKLRQPRPKYMKLRDPNNARGLDGTMR